jgi:anhydro-N-acetylmuramic acid kinase
MTHEILGLSSDAKEALAFAILAFETIHGRPGNLPTCTSADLRVVLGKIVPGANYRQFVRSCSGPSRSE